MTAGSKRWVAIGGTALVIVGAGAYMARATLFPPQDAADKLLAQMKQTPEDQRFEQMRALREKSEQMSEAEREKLRAGMRGMFEEQMETRIQEYENASEDQKVAILDKQIDEMVARRKEWEKRRAEREAEEAKGGQQPGGPATGAPPAGGPGGEARGGPDAGGPGGRRGPQTVAERKQREESRNADSDVRRIRYFRALQERAKSRGVDMGRGPMGGPGGGRGGPGGGRGG